MKYTNPISKISIIILLISSVISLNSCNKDDDNNDEDLNPTIDFNVSLKSSNSSKTVAYDSINLEILQISIHTSSDTGTTSGWFDLATNVGIYDLLDFVNNDTIIAYDSIFEVRSVSQIRLLLGENNTISEDGIIYDLETPSAQTSGIKVQIHTTFIPGESYKVVLDFDSDHSIINTGNGKYKLKPVINTTIVQEEG